MPRYTLAGARLVHRPVRYEVPRELCAAIDAQAARVIRLRGDRGELEGRVRLFRHRAFEARAGADIAASRGLRKLLSDHAVELAGKAEAAGIELDRAERDLGDAEMGLRQLHAHARSWVRGEHEAPEEQEPEGLDGAWDGLG